MTTTAYEIPLSAVAQTFNIQINGVAYILNFVWNDQAQCWMLDINDQNNNPIIQGIPLVTGADLLEQYTYLDLGFGLVAQTDHDLLAPPTYANLGTTGHLYALVVTTP